MRQRVPILIAGICSWLLSCGPAETVQLSSVNEPSEVASQLGDVMASVDEVGRGGQVMASYGISSAKNVAFEKIFSILVPEAQAATCGSAEFAGCSSNAVIRNFSGCSVGSYVLTGTVTMTWTGGTSCTLSAAGQSVRIVPNYTVAGHNMTLRTTKTGTNGITLNWSSGAGTAKVFHYSNDGIRRALSSNGTTLLEINTRTTSNLVVSGTTRGARTMSGGALEVVTTNDTCTFQPNSISWGATNCNCATTGNWTGTCSKMGSVTMSITSCGVATLAYTENGASKNQTVSLDRCVQN